MAVTVKQVRERLKVQLETLTGIKIAYAYAPRSIAAANCPCFIITPAEADHSFNVADGHEIQRRWQLTLLIGPVGEGIVGDLQKKLDPYFELMEDEFAANMQLDELDSELIHAFIDEDSGEGIIRYPADSENKFFGCAWSVITTVKRAVTTGL